MSTQPTQGRRIAVAVALAVVSTAAAALYVADLGKGERDTGWAAFAVAFVAASLVGPVVRRLEGRIAESDNRRRAEQLPLVGILIGIAVVPIVVGALSEMIILAVIGLAGGAATGTAVWYAIRPPEHR